MASHTFTTWRSSGAVWRSTRFCPRAAMVMVRP
jgi:hypothetical protein